MAERIEFSVSPEKTYCNPIPLPDYPIGRKCYEESFSHRCDYRETADPTVIYEDGKWYLYPSCGMVYITEDFIHWEHRRMEPYDCGYAPTVVKHKGRFYLTACSTSLFVSDTPDGPFERVGDFTLPSGEYIYVDDPMLFSDDDGRLYFYFGCGGDIKGVELDTDCPTKLLSEPSVMFSYDTENHEWERMGDFNEDPSYSWIEGAWMYKRGDTYYLTYCAPGTEWITYAMGAYKSKSPLGPFEYMETSPFISKRYGLVRGPGHGCLVDGPNGTLWAFYTCCMCYGGNFERRIGFDPIGFDENGNIIPTEATEIPQLAPGYNKAPHLGNGAGLIPLTQRKSCHSSSEAPGRDSLYAVDDSMITWWQPSSDDPEPTLTVKLGEVGFRTASVRLIWRDVGLDIKKGYLPGPFGYKIEALDKDGEWICVLDKSDNKTDMCIDYLPLESVIATEVRLKITSHPENIEPGLINFTVFGTAK
ncbi:MAG: hypothetical protein E7660_01485 [Ruminococcaceae bacterium]|nr:hypothetical protein [Oscillospiraceae bacterium]